MKHSIISFDGHRVHAKAVACGFLLIVAGAQAGLGQQPAAASGTAARAALPANAPAPVSTKSANAGEGPVKSEYGEAAKPPRPRGEGIRIHGHWALELKDANGKVDDKRDFDNSLTTGDANGIGGDQILAGLLSGSLVTGPPFVGLFTGSTTGLDPDVICISNGACNQATGLTQLATFSPAVSWVISGNYTVTSVNLPSISAVELMLPVCFSASTFLGSNSGGYYVFTGNSGGHNNTQNSAQCTASGFSPVAQGAGLTGGALTFTTIPNGPMPVTAGEVLSIVVTITFS